MKKRLTHDYRIFVGAFPTGDLADRIQALRQRHDPQTASITAPHVTLAGTYWRAGPAIPENESDTIARLQTIQDQLHPFELGLGGVRSFLPATPVLYLHVTPTAELLTVRRTLLAALGQDKHHHFVPHLTLTMRLGKDETESLLAGCRKPSGTPAAGPSPSTNFGSCSAAPPTPRGATSIGSI